MNDQELKNLGEKLRESIPPQTRSELSRDLWPDLLRKTDESRVRIPWFDWALVALAAAVLIFFPGVIPALLYHL
jgi:hypothetical protein